jgi:glycosyltransferase involved in cell wall biosynthesis
MNNPIISICCITYNHEKYIADAIDGFLLQKCNFQFEIIIHDDASTDRTPEIIRNYENRYPGLIRSIYQTENQYSKYGFGVCLDYLFIKAKGKYIALCEGDDYWIDQSKLQIQYDYMESHTECSLICHASNYVNENKKFNRCDNTFSKDCLCTIEDIIYGKKNIIATASMLFRTKYIYQLPQFYYDAPVGDLPLQLFLYTKGSVYYMKKSMAAHRLGVSVSWSSEMKRGNTKIKRIKLYEQLELMYIRFNEYSTGKYWDSVEIGISETKFGALLANKNYLEIKKLEYKKFYKKLSLRTRISINLSLNAPNIHFVLKNLKTKLLLKHTTIKIESKNHKM